MRTLSQSPDLGKRKETFFNGLLRKARLPSGKNDHKNEEDNHSIPDPDWPQRARLTKKESILSQLKVYNEKINPYGKNKHIRGILLNMETLAKVIEAPKGYQNCAPARLCINIEDLSAMVREDLNIERFDQEQITVLKDILAITNGLIREYQAIVDLLGPFIGVDSAMVPDAVVLLSVSKMMDVVEQLLERMQELADEYENWMLDVGKFQSEEGSEGSEGIGSGDERDASMTALVG